MLWFFRATDISPLSHEHPHTKSDNFAIRDKRWDILFVSIYNYLNILYNSIFPFPEVICLGICKMLVLENSWQALSTVFEIPHLQACSESKHQFEGEINSNFLKISFILLY